jgi:predicted nuclease of predicted toxin-antitoxin system
LRILLDQDVYHLTAVLLSGLGHEVLRAAGLGLARAADTELLRAALAEKCILVTRDRDFGYLVMNEEYRCGVIFLRITPDTVEAVHNQLRRLLRDKSSEELNRSFCVVEPGRYRIRSFPRHAK